MRTIIAAALAFALAVPATLSTASACGGGDDVEDAPANHTVRGTAGYSTDRSHGHMVVFVSYPIVDGTFSGRYGDYYELTDDRASRAFAHDLASRGNQVILETITLSRTGETGAWRLVSRQIGNNE